MRDYVSLPCVDGSTFDGFKIADAVCPSKTFGEKKARDSTTSVAGAVGAPAATPNAVATAINRQIMAFWAVKNKKVSCNHVSCICGYTSNV